MTHVDHERLLALIVAHPGMAGKAAHAGNLTAECTSEYGGARIDQCNEKEFERLSRFYAASKKKFGFAFVVVVKGSKRPLTLAAVKQRLQNTADTEFQRALTEINKLTRMTLEVLSEDYKNAVSQPRH